MNSLQHVLGWLARAAVASLAAAPALVLAAHPFPVSLKDAAGNVLTSASTSPYDSEQSCGGCHDFQTITQGYHFQQGRTDALGSLNVSDTFLGAMMGAYDLSDTPTKGTGAWWKLSDGMYGKW